MKRFIILLLLAASILTPSAAVLTTVPMQGSMLMPEVYYHSDTDSVTVDLSAIGVTAQLTPLLVSHPADRFSPADPWFDCLDPTRQGLAFSRRYGFDMHVMSDLLPLNRQLWIRKLSGSPELGIYDYSSNPKKWTPIFGTGGSSTAAPWSGLMWHVGITAPPGTNSHAAVFEVYVVDTDTGVEVAGSSSGAVTLNWTTVPDGRPELFISAGPGGRVDLSWEDTSTNWVLVSEISPAGGGWMAVTNAPIVRDQQSTVQLNLQAQPRFFRLKLNR